MATGSRPLNSSQQEELNIQLTRAAEVGDLNEIIRCLNDGADINGKDGTGYTALHRAAVYGHDSVVDFLCSRKADMNIKTNVDDR
jgi:ankyrin repeat protein